jgi:glycosyltransferase involved in cell wall biosynthesis
MVVNNLDVGGLEKVVLDLLRGLPRHGVAPSLVCLSGRGALFDEVALDPADVLVLDKPPVLDLRARLRAPGVMARVARFLVGREIEVVHAHNLAPLLFAGIPARLLGPGRPAVVYSEHNQIHRSGPRARARFRQYARLADLVVAVSHDLGRTLRDGLRIRPPVEVIHNGIDGARFSGGDRAGFRAGLGLGPEELLVGTAVVLSEQKGLPYLLEAARQVRDRDPGVRFVVAGDGPARAGLERAAAALGLGDGLRFLGLRRDVPRIVAGLDVYVLPSLWEGLPLALLEALAAGLPIVATEVGGNPEIVTHGVNGLLVPPRDPRALAEAILALRGDARLRARVAASNTARFAREFSLEAMVAAHAALYRGARAPGAGTRPPDAASGRTRST